jgi:mRNA interferase MazF
VTAATTRRWTYTKITNPLPSRGRVVLVDYPFSSGSGFKRRPGLVVQNDRDNVTLTSTIVAMITSNTARVSEPAQLLIDILAPEGSRPSLRQVSTVICTNLFTVEKRLVLHGIGVLSGNIMSQIDGCLKVGRGLS